MGLCAPKGHSDPLCVLANKYKQYMNIFDREYRRNKLKAYERLFETRSVATAQAKDELNKMAKHAQASVGYKKAAKLLNIMSTFLVRNPLTTNAYSYLMSGPNMCMSWNSLQQQIMDVRFVK